MVLVILVGCTSTPKVKKVYGQVEILEHKGSRFGLAQPEQVSIVLDKSVQLQKLNQQLIFTENKPIDILEYKIIATPFDVVEETKEIFFKNNPFRNPKIMEYIIDMLEDASVTYITKGYFDISNFYGKL